MSHNLKHQLKPYVTDDILKEQQHLQSASSTSSASNTLSSKNASSSNLDVNQQQQSQSMNSTNTTTTTANITQQHITNSNHNLNNDTKDSTKQSSNINLNASSAAGAINGNTNGAAGTGTVAANSMQNAPTSTSSQNTATSTTSAATATGDSNNDTTDLESFFRDWRHFECQTWHLEPTVRILSWAGKSIEPYGIDYILNKLGFSHARTTIPKWLQRGFMDPLDKVQALMMLQLLTMIRENKQEPTMKNNKNSN